MESKYKVKQITKLYTSCDRCGLPIINCICSRIPEIKTKAEIWILCSEREFYRPSNTARLLKLANPQGTEIILWERTKPSQELIEKINNENYKTYILFPDENDDNNEEKLIVSRDNDSIDKALETGMGNSEKFKSLAVDDDGDDRNSKKTVASKECGKGLEKTKAFILLDGTWKEAAKMYRKSDYLKKLPRITLKPEHKSEYTLRKGAGEGELCTIEAAIEVLRLNGEEKEAAVIKDVFDLFMKGFKVGASGVGIFD